MIKMMMSKNLIPDKLYFRIGDVSEILGVKPYVLRYWESEFPLVAPQKSGTGQRVYRKGDVETLLLIKSLLYEQRYSIAGARKRLKELRKIGELAASRKLAVRDGGHEKLSQELRQAVNELKAWVGSPISDLFRF